MNQEDTNTPWYIEAMHALGVPLADPAPEVEVEGNTEKPEETEETAKPLSLYWQLADRELKSRGYSPLRRTPATQWIGKRVEHVTTGACYATGRMSLVLVFDDESVGITNPTRVENVAAPEPWSRSYRHCRNCDRLISPELERFARRNLQQVLCGDPACVQQDMVGRYGCCDKAQLRRCNCHVSTECPDHGIRCHGTHD
jgi:hypothetical protein